MTKPAEPRQALGIVRNYSDLLAIARARLVELDITYATLDDIAGVQDGYSAKLLGPHPSKHLGAMSFAAILGALGLSRSKTPPLWPASAHALSHASATSGIGAPNTLPRDPDSLAPSPSAANAGAAPERGLLDSLLTHSAVPTPRPGTRRTSGHG